MYANKPIPGHKRMQPTARVNRVLHNKSGTLALASFGPAPPIGPAYARSTEPQRSPPRQLQRAAR